MLFALVGLYPIMSEHFRSIPFKLKYYFQGPQATAPAQAVLPTGNCSCTSCPVHRRQLLQKLSFPQAVIPAQAVLMNRQLLLHKLSFFMFSTWSHTVSANSNHWKASGRSLLCKDCAYRSVPLAGQPSNPLRFLACVKKQTGWRATFTLL